MGGAVSAQKCERFIGADPMDQRVDAAIAFMIANLHRKLTPVEIAQSVRLSTSHLRHIFKDETGTSLTRYLRELRLKRAKQLLETTFLTVKEVCSAVGIDGVSHFVRDFEKIYRMTPARYAARRRQVTDRP
jgi:transcriptional regulator GlxA family with amidase domain